MAELIQIRPHMTWLNPDHVSRVDYDAEAEVLEIEMINTDLSYRHPCDYKEAHRILCDLGFPLQWTTPK